MLVVLVSPYVLARIRDQLGADAPTRDGVEVHQQLEALLGDVRDPVAGAYRDEIVAEESAGIRRIFRRALARGAAAAVVLRHDARVRLIRGADETVRRVPLPAAGGARESQLRTAPSRFAEVREVAGAGSGADEQDVVGVRRLEQAGIPADVPRQQPPHAELPGLRDHLLQGWVGGERVGQRARTRRIRAAELDRRRRAVALREAAVERERPGAPGTQAPPPG